MRKQQKPKSENALIQAISDFLRCSQSKKSQNLERMRNAYQAWVDERLEGLELEYRVRKNEYEKD